VTGKGEKDSENIDISKPSVDGSIEKCGNIKTGTEGLGKSRR
jgi:hypothetical protein